MRSIKRLFASALLASPWIAQVSLAGPQQQHQQQQQRDSVLSVDVLRGECEKFRGPGSQTQPFAIKVDCAGYNEYWESSQGKVHSGNDATLEVSVIAKNGRYVADGFHATYPMPETDSSCSVWTKKRLSTPNNFGPVLEVKECSDITKEKLFAICADQVNVYCADNIMTSDQKQQVQGQQGQQGQQNQNSQGTKQLDPDTACTLTTVETIDTCSHFGDVAQQKQQQQQQQAQQGQAQQREEL